MKSLRYALRLTIAFVSRFRGLLIISVLGGLLISVLVSFLLPRLLRSSTRIGVAGRFHPDELPSFILDDVSSGLTSLDESGFPVPAFAKSWTQSDEGRIWTFKINENLYWHDETPVSSSSLIYEFDDVSVTYPDESTIEFRLKDPFAPFPTVVSKPLFKKERGLLGTGEWKVKNLKIIGSIVSELEIEKKSGDRKIIKFYPTESSSKLAYKLGEVDRLENIFDPSPLDSWKSVDTKINKNTDKIVTLFFNTSDPILADKSLRQALIYSINKTSLGGDRAISPIDPKSWAYNSQVKKYTYDIERADELLKDFPDELLEKPIQIVSTPLLLPVAETISKYWSERGVKSVVQVSSVVPSDFQVYLTILDVPADPDQYSLWHSTQDANISHYDNDRIDKLLEDGRQELEQEERKRIYLDFQRFILEDVPAAFLYHPETYTLSRK